MKYKTRNSTGEIVSMTRPDHKMALSNNTIKQCSIVWFHAKYSNTIRQMWTWTVRTIWRCVRCVIYTCELNKDVFACKLYVIERCEQSLHVASIPRNILWIWACNFFLVIDHLLYFLVHAIQLNSNVMAFWYTIHTPTHAHIVWWKCF